MSGTKASEDDRTVPWNGCHTRQRLSVHHSLSPPDRLVNAHYRWDRRQRRSDAGLLLAAPRNAGVCSKVRTGRRTDNSQNFMHSLHNVQISPDQARGSCHRILSAILGCGLGLMKPNLGSKITQRGGECGTVAWPGLFLSLLNNRPSAYAQQGLLTHPIARIGPGDKDRHGTWLASVRWDAKKGVSVSSVKRAEACDKAGNCAMSWQCAAGPRGENVHVQTYPNRASSNRAAFPIPTNNDGLPLELKLCLIVPLEALAPRPPLCSAQGCLVGKSGMLGKGGQTSKAWLPTLSGTRERG